MGETGHGIIKFGFFRGGSFGGWISEIVSENEFDACRRKVGLVANNLCIFGDNGGELGGDCSGKELRFGTKIGFEWGNLGIIVHLFVNVGAVE